MSTTLNMNHTVWTEIQGGRYHDAILDILCQCNPYCCFVFNHKWIKQNESRKSSPVSFRCRGSCKFDDCPVQDGFGNKMKYHFHITTVHKYRFFVFCLYSSCVYLCKVVMWKWYFILLPKPSCSCAFSVLIYIPTYSFIF